MRADSSNAVALYYIITDDISEEKVYFFIYII
jgi:hypothetical protein